jgi:hypothetical protein
LGALGSHRLAISDNGQINDLVITGTSAVAGFTLVGSGGKKAVRLNGTNLEYLK